MPVKARKSVVKNVPLSEVRQGSRFFIGDGKVYTRTRPSHQLEQMMLKTFDKPMVAVVAETHQVVFMPASNQVAPLDLI